MVSTSLMTNGLWWNAIQVQAALSGARVEPRPSRDEPATALANLYRCADGRWFLLNVSNDDRDWPTFLRAIERPDLVTDPRFATNAARVESCGAEAATSTQAADSAPPVALNDVAIIAPVQIRCPLPNNGNNGQHHLREVRTVVKYTNARLFHFATVHLRFSTLEVARKVRGEAC
jgi:crotonobetainyl-CoA:carnitine CoA-transferase CaiB-like acyl-CoA transferase